MRTGATAPKGGSSGERVEARQPGGSSARSCLEVSRSCLGQRGRPNGIRSRGRAWKYASRLRHGKIVTVCGVNENFILKNLRKTNPFDTNSSPRLWTNPVSAVATADTGFGTLCPTRPADGTRSCGRTETQHFKFTLRERRNTTKSEDKG